MINPTEAAHALEEIDVARARSSIFSGYAYSAPWFVLWGVVWLIANCLTDLLPHMGGRIWAIATPIGVLGSIALAFRPSPVTAHRRAWQSLATSAVGFAFVFAAFFILRPQSGAQINAFISVFVASAYMLQGIWRGWRIFALGLALAVATIGGYVYLGAHYALWMGVVGGGALILGGLWLRTA